MQYRTLGRTQLEVSEVGVGGAQFGIPDYMGEWDPFTAAAQQATTATVHRALELGYTYFDTAPGYGDGRSEEMLGNALKGHRDEVVVATKVSQKAWAPAEDRSASEEIRSSVEESLRRLQTDAIDVLQFHGGVYAQRHLDAILKRDGLETFVRLKEEGKIRFIGFTTEMPTGALEELIATDAFDTMQVRYSLMYQHPSDYESNAGIIRQADERGMGIVLMRPLTSGIFQKLMAQTFPQIDTLEVGRMLLNYVLSDPYVDVALIGMREPRYAEINNAISDDVESRLDLVQIHHRFFQR